MGGNESGRGGNPRDRWGWRRYGSRVDGSDVRVPVLVLSGPVGVGKTTVAHEMFDQLSGRDVAHAVVDLDALGICWPYGEGDPSRRAGCKLLL